MLIKCSTNCQREESGGKSTKCVHESIHNFLKQKSNTTQLSLARLVHTNQTKSMCHGSLAMAGHGLAPHGNEIKHTLDFDHSGIQGISSLRLVRESGSDRPSRNPSWSSRVRRLTESARRARTFTPHTPIRIEGRAYPIEPTLTAAAPIDLFRVSDRETLEAGAAIGEGRVGWQMASVKGGR
jgi:hypothetical protein